MPSPKIQVGTRLASTDTRPAETSLSTPESARRSQRRKSAPLRIKTLPIDSPTASTSTPTQKSSSLRTVSTSGTKGTAPTYFNLVHTSPKGSSIARPDQHTHTFCGQCLNWSQHAMSLQYKYQKYKQLAMHFYDDSQNAMELVQRLQRAEQRIHELENQLNLPTWGSGVSSKNILKKERAAVVGKQLKSEDTAAEVAKSPREPSASRRRVSADMSELNGTPTKRKRGRPPKSATGRS